MVLGVVIPQIGMTEFNTIICCVYYYIWTNNIIGLKHSVNNKVSADYQYQSVQV